MLYFYIVVGIGAGAQDPMSHLAYYANGGKEQPGCGVFIDPPTGGFNAIPTYVGDMVGDFICSHGRAFELFSDSLISTCQSVAYACDSYKNFQTVICFNMNNYVDFSIITFT